LHFSLTGAGDFCKVTAKSEIEWHNGDMRRESASRKAREAPRRASFALVASFVVGGAIGVTAVALTHGPARLPTDHIHRTPVKVVDVS
jgi:hypothetical protein